MAAVGNKGQGGKHIQPRHCLRRALDALNLGGNPLADIGNAIEPEPPISAKDGGIIRSGFHAEVDSLRSAKTEGKNWLSELEAA